MISTFARSKAFVFKICTLLKCLNWIENHPLRLPVISDEPMPAMITAEALLSILYTFLKSSADILPKFTGDLSCR